MGEKPLYTAVFLRVSVSDPTKIAYNDAAMESKMKIQLCSKIERVIDTNGEILQIEMALKFLKSNLKIAVVILLAVLVGGDCMQSTGITSRITPVLQFRVMMQIENGRMCSNKTRMRISL